MKSVSSFSSIDAIVENFQDKWISDIDSNGHYFSLGCRKCVDEFHVLSVDRSLGVTTVVSYS